MHKNADILYSEHGRGLYEEGDEREREGGEEAGYRWGMRGGFSRVGDDGRGQESDPGKAANIKKERVGWMDGWSLGVLVL
jgi:hypothetical protein